ncbi:hypothetical protein [Arthrobacter sp. UKPF54-2]|uniref:hypothetical protein n=1 Tax=Arthrobacter sp. UKPF54-2 TaxID=2600159 RepID=UPI0016463110|nr:hypothetical protein [Arthrobacter sp. UKPF54-2]
MPEFTISAGRGVSDVEALALYESVEGSAYTQDPEQGPGFTEGGDFSPEPLRVFALFR